MSRRLQLAVRALVAVPIAIAALATVPAESRPGFPQAPRPAAVTVEGSVVDGALAPVAGVRVALERAGRAALWQITDTAGRFRFAAVDPGAYRVRAERAGYRPAVRDVVIPASAGVVQLPLVVRSERDSDAPPERPAPAGQPVAAGRAGGGGAGTGVAGGVVGGVPRTAAAMPPPQFPPGGTGRGVPQALELRQRDPWNTEGYAHIEGNPFRRTADDPLSTFAADVDTASYANVRRFLSKGQLPPPDAVRVEELVNYFRFAYPEPDGRHPVSVTTQVGECPWAPGHKLVLIGVRAKAIDQRAVPGRNIVLLVDVSGSMASPDKLPLVKTGLRMFVDTLRDDDRIAIVVYAGASGLALPSTRASQRQRIHDALQALDAGGSTNGAEGLILAYRTAREEFVPGGVNRVILATDGDFNVGVTSQGDLVRLIEREKQSGVFLSVLGVGTGNLKDSTMELLADRGNGHYAYLDSLFEARRVLVREGGATLETVAKDVKFQVEFNPAAVGAWKLIGYENRLLRHEEFNDDTRDGGELGAGHTVTVLYEVVPAGAPLPDGLAPANGAPAVDPLVYQTDRRPTPGARADELLMVKVRYKQPEAGASQLLTAAVRAGGPAPDVAFAAAVAEFGLLLRDATAGPERWRALTARLRALPAPAGAAADRESFLELVELAEGLKRTGVR